MTKRAENAETVATPVQSKPDIPPAVAGNLARLRAERALSLDQLSAKSGLPGHTLRALETGSEEPTIKTLWSLANALGVPFSALITTDRGSRPPPLRAETRRQLSSKDAVRTSEVYAIRLPAHASERALPRSEGALENALVISGYAEIEVEGTVHRLRAGESAAFPADVERRYFNPNAEPATLHLVISEVEE